jgi:predicted nucleotidyltransferase
MTQMRAAIEEALIALEREEDVRVCLAVESGSRAWGFASVDSDYDVRLIYVHRPEWYLSLDLETKPDSIQQPAEVLDLSGWDVRKALRLFRKSNPPILEWLQSPTVYREVGNLAAAMRARLALFYSPRSCAFHYLHMAQGNWREYLQGDVVWRKKYLYVLRPLLALRWIEQDRGAVPMEFARLINATVTEMNVRRAINELVAAKIAGMELDRGPRIGVLSGFIGGEMKRAEARVAASAPPRVDAEDDLDSVFRSILGETWVRTV